MRERSAIAVPSVPFRDVTAEANLQFQHFNGAYGLKLLPETMGPGVCVLDYDNDGWQDILLINGCPWPGQDWPNGSPQPCSETVPQRRKWPLHAMSRRVRAYTPFISMAWELARATTTMMVTSDLFVTAVGGCHLLHNVAGNGGQRRFEEVTTRMGLPPSGGWPSV
ncbi:MAG: hypothetical protein KatS3mg106_787 [Gemmataceae bacterium]|nr:MAG: hypothetical protein KatS3mg106_787 [Gemmataceae bacterium]